MTINLDGLSEAESWNISGDGPLPDGDYLLEVTAAVDDVSKAGNPKIDFTFRVAHGPFLDRERWDTLPITPKTLGRVKATLEAMGRAIPKGEFSLEPKSLVKARVVGVLRTEDEEYEGETKPRQRIRGYRPASTFKASASPAGDGIAAGLASQMGATQTSLADDGDDIPF